MENETQSPEKVPEQTENKQEKSTLKQIAKEIFTFIVIAVCVVLPFRMFIAEPYIVSGHSMDYTFATGHYLIVDKISYEIGNPKRNSVVVFSFPEIANVPAENGKNLIKRVIGLPGDTVTISGNTITITNSENQEGFVLDQSYVDLPLPTNLKITLKQDEYFVMGDNRKESFDSRSWGVLPRKNIIGKPILRLWPLSKIGFLPGDDTKNQLKK